MRFQSIFALLLATYLPLSAAEPPASNPIRAFYKDAADAVPAWVSALPWDRATQVDPVEGFADDALAKAIASAAEAGGGVVQLSAGVYRFENDVILDDRVIIRGADPSGAAKDESYQPATRMEFPKYEPSMEGSGTPSNTAFRAIRLRDAAKTGHCGVVNVAINRGHIHFAEADQHDTAPNRLVFGCKLTNTAAADAHIPSTEYQQAPHQRFTARHQAAIHVHSGEGLFIANNRIAKSGDDNFIVKPYTVVKVQGNGQDFRLDGGKKFEFLTLEEGVVFDYDNRPGIYANMFGIGSSGRGSDHGTPESHPHGFRKGTVIRDNHIYCSGRAAIAFSGDGVYCAYNTIRYPKDLVRPTTTGLVLSDGSATNDNRALTMRGYRWHAHRNDYEVHSNKSIGGGKINDGEGIMHENHHNSIVRDSKMTENTGNQYLCLWAVPIDGLLVQGNKVTADRAAIHIASGGREIRRVQIVGNELTRGGIKVETGDAEEISINGNRYTGDGPASIAVKNLEWVGENSGFEVTELKPKKQ